MVYIHYILIYKRNMFVCVYVYIYIYIHKYLCGYVFFYILKENIWIKKVKLGVQF